MEEASYRQAWKWNEIDQRGLVGMDLFENVEGKLGKQKMRPALQCDCSIM